LPTGEVSVKMVFEADESKPGTGGEVTLWVGERQIGAGRMPRTVPIAFSSYAGMDIGRDNGLVVDLDYEPKAPYEFTGTVRSVLFDLKSAIAHEHERALHEHASLNAVAQGVSA
jgi:arylsulfatase